MFFWASSPSSISNSSLNSREGVFSVFWGLPVIWNKYELEQLAVEREKQDNNNKTG